MKNFKREREYTKKLKKIQKKYKKEYFGEYKNKEWRKDWLPIIKYDHFWDWSCILDVLMYKLELTKLNLEIYSAEEEESLKEKLIEIENCITAFKSWRNKEYTDEAMEFSNKHVTHFVLFYRGKDTKDEILRVTRPASNWLFDWELENNPTVLKYCSENNLDPKKFVKEQRHCYGGEWDDEENLKIWREMMEKAGEQEQKDLENCFLMVAKSLRGWWY